MRLIARLLLYLASIAAHAQVDPMAIAGPRRNLTITLSNPTASSIRVQLGFCGAAPSVGAWLEFDAGVRQASLFKSSIAMRSDCFTVQVMRLSSGEAVDRAKYLVPAQGDVRFDLELARSGESWRLETPPERSEREGWERLAAERAVEVAAREHQAAVEQSEREVAEKKRHAEALATAPRTLVATLLADWNTIELRAEEKWLGKELRVSGRVGKVFANEGAPYFGIYSSSLRGGSGVAFCSVSAEQGKALDPDAPVGAFGRLEKSTSLGARYAWTLSDCELTPAAAKDLASLCAKSPGVEECKRR